jgi:hypothetical protein
MSSMHDGHIKFHEDPEFTTRGDKSAHKQTWSYHKLYFPDNIRKVAKNHYLIINSVYKYSLLKSVIH